MGKISTTYSPLDANAVNLRYQTLVINDGDLTFDGLEYYYLCDNPWYIYVFDITVNCIAYINPSTIENNEKLIIKNLSTASFAITSLSSGVYINIFGHQSYQGLLYTGAVEFVRYNSYWYSLEEKDKNYVHNQLIPSKIWTINHGLNKYPAVRVVDGSNNPIMPKIIDIDNNTVQIEHLTPQTGQAYFN